jgi:hypothetical protein
MSLFPAAARVAGSQGPTIKKSSSEGETMKTWEFSVDPSQEQHHQG